MPKFKIEIYNEREETKKERLFDINDRTYANMSSSVCIKNYTALRYIDWMTIRPIVIEEVRIYGNGVQFDGSIDINQYLPYPKDYGDFKRIARLNFKNKEKPRERNNGESSKDDMSYKDRVEKVSHRPGSEKVSEEKYEYEVEIEKIEDIELLFDGTMFMELELEGRCFFLIEVSYVLAN